MRMMDLIVKKRDGQALSKEEIEFLVKGYTDGSIPDYQMSSFLMAGFLNGFTEEETGTLTLCMAHSGEQMDLSPIPGIKVDKHSTGGVGDKTTLIVGPMAAACGVPVAKMSGRGLGHTGGTADKLEAIPGYCIALNQEQFIRQVQEIQIALVSQTGNLAPADKKIYALRDVTGTVESIPLISASIMSKKIAAGADAILLDVKVGSGAFMKNLEDARKLSQTMVSIGEQVGRKTIALLTNMDIPLGRAIGNNLEVIESVETLQNRGPKDLTDLCVELAANMLYLAGKGDLPRCRELARTTLEDGSAFQKFRQVVLAQGGDVSCLDDTERFPKAPIITEFRAGKNGFIGRIDTLKCGIASCVLGAGRERKEDSIDYSAGILLNKTYGDPVAAGEVIAWLHTSREELLTDAVGLLKEAFCITAQKPEEEPLIFQ